MTLFPALAGVAMAWFASQGPMGLEDALKVAEQNSFAIRSANAAVEKARQRAREAKGNLGPRLTADATYTRFDRALTSNFGGSDVTTRPIDSKDGKLTLSMPIDIAGVTGKAVRAADRSVHVAEMNREAVRNDLRQSVKKAFFAALQAQEGVRVAEETLARAEDRLKNVKAELAVGTRAKVDVIRLETQVTQANADLIAAKNGASLALSALNNVLGRPIETPTELRPHPLWRPTQASEDGLIAIALENRPDLKALRIQQDVLAFVRMAEERGNLPSLSFAAVHSRTFGSTGFGASSANTTGTLALSIPIWDSGITRARVKAARQDEESLKVQREQAELGVSLEVRQAMLNLKNADARLQVAEKQVALAEETYRLTTIKFEAGEGIPLEVADASTQLTIAKTQLVSAKYDYLRAIADLERAIGKDLMPEGNR